MAAILSDIFTPAHRLNAVDEISVTLILPAWQHDVKSALHALQIRNELTDAPLVDTPPPAAPPWKPVGRELGLL